MPPHLPSIFSSSPNFYGGFIAVMTGQFNLHPSSLSGGWEGVTESFNSLVPLVPHQPATLLFLPQEIPKV